ncbi:Lsr2 family protein [Gleimia hominis]|uniref:Lsr2 family protein n=1 Tax=Gleimia hominis TaxID=595468 RepID=A0ABU3I9T7_9ACTO|nr:Lsr2 family protein [Gleimia hominis]MDT3766968.1 Lsr2 family protein [Gleimia hominis]
MASITKVVLIDDVNGETADETVSFSLDGVRYEIDLTSDNAKRLRAMMDEWIQHAKRVGGRRRSAGSVVEGSRSEASVIREWASMQGIEVADRGRIPHEIREAFYREQAQ